jgi:hypothetical protein
MYPIGYVFISVEGVKNNSIAALQDRSSLGLHPGMLEVIDKSIPGL